MNLLTIISKKNYAVDGILKELWNYNIREARGRIFYRGDELVIEIDEILGPLAEDGGAMGNFAQQTLPAAPEAGLAKEAH